MEITKELAIIISLISNGMIWFYIGIFFTLSYLFVSLLTWSFLKPLKYLGIPTLLVGILFLLLRVSSVTIINLQEYISMINTLLPSVLKPVLFSGILCTSLGIIMIVLYIIINNKIKNKI